MAATHKFVETFFKHTRFDSVTATSYALGLPGVVSEQVRLVRRASHSDTSLSGRDFPAKPIVGQVHR